MFIVLLEHDENEVNIMTKVSVTYKINIQQKFRFETNKSPIDRRWQNAKWARNRIFLKLFLNLNLSLYKINSCV